MLDPDVDRRLLVEQIVDRFAGLDDGARTERYHLYRVLRAIDLAAILSAAIARPAARASRSTGRHSTPGSHRCGR